MATLQEVQDLPVGGVVIPHTVGPAWNGAGEMNYLVGTALHKAANLQNPNDFVVDPQYGLTVKGKRGENWHIRVSEVSILGSTGKANLKWEPGTGKSKIKTLVSTVTTANVEAAKIAARIEAGRLALKTLASALSAIPGLPAGAHALLSGKVGQLLLANKLQLLAGSGVLPQGKTQDAVGFLATGALDSAYLDIIHGLDIEGLLVKLTAGLLPGGDSKSVVVQKDATAVAVKEG